MKEEIQKFAHQFTISGLSGVGTTTLRNELSKILGEKYRSISGGTFMRKVAMEKHKIGEARFVDFVRLNRLHPEYGYDNLCDQWVAEEGRSDYLVVEGRLAHHFVPTGFHICLICSDKVRAHRRWLQFQGNGIKQSEWEVYEDLRVRDIEDYERLEKVYNREVFWPIEKFDLAMNTALMTPLQMVREALLSHGSWLIRNHLANPQPPRPRRRLEDLVPA